MLEMESVSKVHRNHDRSVTALADASLRIERGDFVSVVGTSGSGKSTLLLTLGGMLSPSAGRVLLEGESLYEMPQRRRAIVRREKIGFLFQTFNLVPYLSALENVQVPLLLAGAGSAEQKDKAAALLEHVGLADRVGHRPPELSIGQQQRVALARMLANGPEIILADEPTGNLDPETGRQVISFLQELNEEGRTVVLVTHDPDAAAKAKRTLRIVEGQIHA